ncbi:MAG: anti-sigma factor [Bacteroidota bacterium]
MDHKQDILQSDILRRYALGDVTIEEKIKVDMMLIDQPEVRQALREVERQIEQHARSESIKAPAEVRQTIIKELYPHVEGESKVPPAQWYTSMLRYAAAMIIGIAATWAMMNGSLQSTKSAYAELQADYNLLFDDCEELSELHAFLNAGDTHPYLLTSVRPEIPAEVVVHWNDAQQKAMLRVLSLPAISASETYQLWADVDGVMLDLGVFDAAMAIVDPISVGYLARAESLNVTIEPKGGSSHPTVSRLTVATAI